MVASYTQLLARRYEAKLDSDAREFIGFAVDGATRMQTLIQDLLSYSRVTTRGQSFEVTNSATVCSASLRNLQKAIEESGADVEVEPLPEVFADATQLTQVFQNLVGNAIKYCDHRKPEIRIRAEIQNGFAIFSVADNGIGIESQYY